MTADALADTSIPVTKLSNTVQSSLTKADNALTQTAGDSRYATAAQGAKADSAYQKPSGGVPLSDLKKADLDTTYASAAQGAKADAALTQPVADGRYVRFVDQNGDPLSGPATTTIHVNTTTGEIDDITFEGA